ncbi:MAG: 50S ribosomal protein L25 [Gaiellales bacterium]
MPGADRYRLAVRPRTEFGTRESRRLRRGGLIPGTLYGAAEPTQTFAVEERELRGAIGNQNLNAILDVVVEGSDEATHAVVKDYQLHPTRSRLLHIDLQRIRLDKPIQAAVPIEVVGVAPGLVGGGLLNIILRELQIEGLPMELPDVLEVDISGMEVGESRSVGDVSLPGNMTLLDDPEDTVLTIAVTRVAVLDEEEEVEEELEEGEEPAEDGGEPPADEGPAAAEPDADSS